jgi:predicted nucleotidyltransferase
MNLEMLKKSERIIFECVAGSNLYNLHTPQSDTDIRGLYINPSTEYLGLSEPPNQVGDEKHDTVYYSLKRFFELAMTANPNIIEILYCPEISIKINTPIMQKLMDNRDLFISKKSYFTHIGYGHAQLEKCRGANKMVNHPEMFEKPKKEDFCWIIPKLSFDIDYLRRKSLTMDELVMPSRPFPLKESSVNLAEFHCAALEHVSNTYRLYRYGTGAKGVFRGDDMLVCESIPIDDELRKFSGLLIYNQHEYEKALQQHRKYNDWLQNRNEARWIDQEKGKLNYDQKNALHCMRLLMSGENILTHGFPLVRFEGEQREYLMKIRRGEFVYEDIMAEVEKRMAKLEELYKTSTIPHSVDVPKIEMLYRELTKN